MSDTALKPPTVFEKDALLKIYNERKDCNGHLVITGTFHMNGNPGIVSGLLHRDHELPFRVTLWEDGREIFYVEQDKNENMFKKFVRVSDNTYTCESTLTGMIHSKNMKLPIILRVAHTFAYQGAIFGTYTASLCEY